jgi:hypothetical protein
MRFSAASAIGGTMPARANVSRFAAPALLVAIVIALAIWRIALLRSGPDPDSDAYGHHGIARQILVDPRDLSVHWVWLPLFHYAQSLMILFGGVMETVRYANVAMWAAVPIVLFVFMGGSKDVAPLLAAIVCALSPIGMQMGTTAQPEPLFCLLVLGCVVAIERKRYVASAAMLAAASLLRYEAWAAIAAIALVLAVDAILARRGGKRRYASRAWLVVAVPIAAIFAWAVLRRINDGEWFSFLHQTHEFANDAMKSTGSLGAGLAHVASDAMYYGVHVAKRVFGPAVWLAPIGIFRTVRRQGILFVLAFGACLGFVTLTWITRSSLGLDRHFVVMLPLYAALIANGVVQIGEIVRDLWRGWAFAVVNAALSVVVVWTTWSVLDPWMHEWRGAIEHGWPDREAVGAYLRTLPPSATIFCDEATVEIISGLDRHRFDRHWVDEPGGTDRIEEAASRDGVVWVATWLRKTHELRDRGAAVAFRPAGVTEEDTGLVVLRVSRR